MLDELIGFFVGGIGRFFFYVFVEIIFEVVFYYIGYLFVKIITFGKYPTIDDSVFSQGSVSKSSYVSGFGLLVTLIAVIIVFLLY